MNQEKKLFYKSAILLILPLMLQNLINVGVTSADVVMLGKVSDAALSGASLGGQIYFIMNLLLFGLTSGVSVLAAQYWGKGDIQTIEKILGLILKVSLGVGLLFMSVVLIAPEPLMRIYSSDREVIEQGVKYLKIVCFSYPLAALSMSYLYTLRCVEKAHIATIVYLASLIINVIVNGFLIFGLWGLPKMGAAGAAVGTLVARVAEVLMALFYDRKRNPYFKLKLSSFKTNNRLLIKDFLFISGPVVINEFMWGLGSSMSAAILGQLGAGVSSANSVVVVVRQLAQVVSFGTAGAAAVMIGKRVGEGKMEQAKMEAKRFHIMGTLFGAAGCLLVLLLRPFILDFVSISEGAKSLLSTMLMILAVLVIAQSHNCTLIVGIYRGGGDTKYGMVIDCLTLWLGSILLGYLAAFVWKLSVPAIFALLLIDELIKIPFCLVHYFRYKWLRNITREIPS